MSLALSLSDTLAAIDRPTAEAICLPNEFYTSPDILEREKRTLFFGQWCFAGLEAQAADPGDAFPVMLAGIPLVFVRDRAGQLRVFHNICRHRGVQLVAEPQKKKKVLACRYHGWTYGLDGGLTRTPHFAGPDNHASPDFDRACMGLAEVRADAWAGMVFVDISGKAPPLADYLAPLARRWSAYDFSQLRYGGTTRFDIAANWKLAIENYLESYHLPFAHPALNASSKMEAHESVVEKFFLGQISHHYDATGRGHDRLPQFPRLPRSKKKLGEYPVVLPNLCLGVQADHVFLLVVDPVAVDRSIEYFHLFFVGDDAMAPSLAQARTDLMAIWAATNQEDVSMVEGMQIGRASPGYADGRFSAYHERTTHEFQRRIARAIADDAAGRA